MPGGNLVNKKVGVWGLSSKSGKGGLRGSPAVHVFITLKGEEPRLAIYDPYVKDSKSV
jgi:UDP-glucose 6-dehydrogenase